ncbi:PH domain-containing protein [Rhodococcus sp. SGAir0479]|uniref:PH domain-containing protein n=1 Tax=Rhodococcus sp. SGAir0479 TaxID=2567884 RepID=UPI0010CD1430|nr:PH domain-containing protein [Rhodococcus sp. SGAir0479]QCQ93082.1 PH domain-containing protein [Rhodococcus sp. SGAir0479]
MPEDEVDHEPSLEWSTPLAAVVALAVGGVLMIAAALLLGLDAPGRFLAGVAAVGMLVVAGLGARQRPKLAIVRADGVPAIAATRMRGRRLYRRADIARARIVPYPRLGRRVPMLEIDAVDPDGTERLLIFGRWDLGADPAVVFDALSVHGLVPAED